MTPHASPARILSDLSVRLVDSVSGGLASHVVEGARVFPLGRTTSDMSMVRVQAAVMEACRRTSDVLGGSYAAVVAEPAVRVENHFVDGIEAAGVALSKGSANFSGDAARIAGEAEAASKDVTVRVAREAIANVRRIGAKAEGLAKFFDGATVTALGDTRTQRDSGQASYLRLATKLAAIGAISAIGISLSTGASAASFARPSASPFVAPPARAFVQQQVATPVQRQAPVVTPSFVRPQAQAYVAPPTVQSQTFVRPQAQPYVAPPARQAQTVNNGSGYVSNGYTGGNNGYYGNDGYRGNGSGGAGAFVGGLVAGTLLGSGVNAYPNSAYPSYGYQPNYGNGYGQRYGVYGQVPYNQGYGNGGYPTPPDPTLIVAAKAVIAVGVNSVITADEVVDHAIVVARKCMAISRGTRPCGVHLQGVNMDFARGVYEVDALGVTIAHQEGNRLTVNQQGLNEALRQAKGVQIHEQDSAGYGDQGYGNRRF